MAAVKTAAAATAAVVTVAAVKAVADSVENSAGSAAPAALRSNAIWQGGEVSKRYAWLGLASGGLLDGGSGGSGGRGGGGDGEGRTWWE